MNDEPVPFTPTERAHLLAKQLRIEELEHILRHFDRTSMDLYHYARAVEGVPSREQWDLVKAQIDEMVDPYGPRNPHR
ncbi:MAG TPA: hypothetical protein VIG24_14060 [Acidimicrobiia bacterium]